MHGVQSQPLHVACRLHSNAMKRKTTPSGDAEPISKASKLIFDSLQSDVVANTLRAMTITMLPADILAFVQQCVQAHKPTLM